MKKILTVLFIMFSVLTMSAEDLVWAMNANSGEQIALSEVDYMIAADNAKEFSIVLNGGATINGVKEVTFTQVSSVIEIAVQEDLQIFPNPVISTFNISGCQEGTTINIFSIDGEVQKSITTASPNHTIDVSDLTPGYYLLSTERSTVKFIKK